jgi:hypothetical protein
MILLYFVPLALALVIAGCSQNKANPSPEPTPVPMEVDTSVLQKACGPSEVHQVVAPSAFTEEFIVVCQDGDVKNVKIK